VDQDLSASWRRIFQRLADLASTRNNWESYRGIKSRATKFPFFPFLGVYLQDLQVLEAKEKTFFGDDMSSRLINFGKMQKLGELLKELVYVQRGSEYSFRHNPRVLAYLLSLKQFSDDELFDMSCRIVPPGEFEAHNRPSDRSFLAATLSPRDGQNMQQVRGVCFGFFVVFLLKFCSCCCSKFSDNAHRRLVMLYECGNRNLSLHRDLDPQVPEGFGILFFFAPFVFFFFFFFVF
jgi:hypothetical protein